MVCCDSECSPELLEASARQVQGLCENFLGRSIVLCFIKTQPILNGAFRCVRIRRCSALSYPTDGASFVAAYSVPGAGGHFAAYMHAMHGSLQSQ